MRSFRVSAFLVVGHQIGFHENRASFCEFHGFFRGQGDFLKLIHDVDPVLLASS
jgi:hypothetical protein